MLSTPDQVVPDVDEQNFVGCAKMDDGHVPSIDVVDASNGARAAADSRDGGATDAGAAAAAAVVTVNTLPNIETEMRLNFNEGLGNDPDPIWAEMREAGLVGIMRNWVRVY